jgi:hypothetical protein
MPGCIDQIEHVVLPILRVVHLDGVALDGNAPFALEVHVVERLFLKFAGVDRSGHLEQSISEGTLPMINMGDDAEVSYVLHGAKVTSNTN